MWNGGCEAVVHEQGRRIVRGDKLSSYEYLEPRLTGLKMSRGRKQSERVNRRPIFQAIRSRLFMSYYSGSARPWSLEQSSPIRKGGG